MNVATQIVYIQDGVAIFSLGQKFSHLGRGVVQR